MMACDGCPYCVRILGAFDDLSVLCRCPKEDCESCERVVGKSREDHCSKCTWDGPCGNCVYGEDP